MPTYVYRREDGTTFEHEQSITEDSLETCPTTGQTVTRVITAGTGLIFKGSGFYLTDYARKAQNNHTPADSKSTEKSSSTETTTSDSDGAPKSSSTPAAKSDKTGASKPSKAD